MMQAFNITIFVNVFVFHTFRVHLHPSFNALTFRHLDNFLGEEGHCPPSLNVPIYLCLWSTQFKIL